MLLLIALFPVSGNATDPGNDQPGAVFVDHEQGQILNGAPWLPGLPDEPAPLDNQCPREVALVPGRPVPEELLDADGLVRCSGVLVPTSTYAYHLRVEASHRALGDLYRLDVGRLEAELAMSEWKLAQLDQPLPWWERPQVQRWAGRLEVGASVALTAWALSEIGTRQN